MGCGGGVLMLNWFEQDYVRPYIRLLTRILLTILAIVLLTQVVPILLTFSFPFVMAFIAAAAMNPVICLLQKKLNAPRSALSVLMVLVALLLVASVIGGFIYAIGREVVALAQNIDLILEYLGNTVTAISVNLYWIAGYLPADAEEMLAGVLDGFMVWMQTHGTAFADTIITNTVNATTRIGGGVVTLVIFIMSSYFMMADFPRLAATVRKFFSTKTYKGYVTIKDATLSALVSYLKAQLLMAAVVFVFFLVALLIIQQDFAFLLAFLFGMIDFLPLVGTAIVVVPWAIVTIVAGEVGLGVYLLAMSLVAFLLRRMIEPKVVGSQMGLSPLTALASIYIGMQLGGVLWMILGPIVAMILVSLYKVGLFNGWIKDINSVLALQRRNRDL